MYREDVVHRKLPDRYPDCAQFNANFYESFTRTCYLTQEKP